AFEEAVERGDLDAAREVDFAVWAPLGADDELRDMWLATPDARGLPEGATPRQPEPAADRLDDVQVPTPLVVPTHPPPPHPPRPACRAGRPTPPQTGRSAGRGPPAFPAPASSRSNQTTTSRSGRRSSSASSCSSSSVRRRRRRTRAAATPSSTSAAPPTAGSQ